MVHQVLDHSLPDNHAPASRTLCPTMGTTYQFLGRIWPTSRTLDAEFLRACRSVLDSIGHDVPRWPQEAWNGQSFRVDEVPGLKVEALAIPEQGTWSFRIEHPDRPSRDRPAVPGRTWITDIGLAQVEGELQVGVRVSCASLPFGHSNAMATTRPDVVVELAKRHGLRDVRALSTQTWRLTTENDLRSLFRLVTDSRRILPVVVRTQADPYRIRRLNAKVAVDLLNPDEFARRFCGVAHVVQLPHHLALLWTRRVRASWRAFHDEVQVHDSGHGSERQQERSNGVARAARLWSASEEEGLDDGPSCESLARRLFESLAARRLDWERVVFLPEARQQRREAERTRLLHEREWRLVEDRTIQTLNEKIHELEKELEQWSNDAVHTAGERDRLKAENQTLQLRLNALNQALKKKSGGEGDRELVLPRAYEAIPHWVNQHLSGRLILHSRALKGLKKADYEDVQLVCRALLLLANEYRDKRLGVENGKKLFMERLSDLGLKLDKSISDERANEQGDEYFVQHPAPTRKRRFLEWHLRKGSNKETRYCLAIYFFWDRDTEQVVVGWLPSHLDNRMT